MVTPPWRDGPVGSAARRRGYDLALAGCLVAAAALSVATGLPLLALAVAFLLSVAAEELLGRSIRGAVLEGAVAESSPPSDALRESVEDLAARVAVATPRVVVTDAPGDGVSIVADDGAPAILLGSDVVESLDPQALRGVLAHELAHWRLGHLRGVDLRTPVARAVGLAVCWAVFLRHLPTPVGLVAGGLYLLVALDRWSTAGRVIYVLGSLGAVLVPRVLVSRARRLEEFRADDVAAALTSPRALCRGLCEVTPSSSGRRAGTGTAGGVGRDPSAGVSALASLTDTYPSVAARLARQGVSPADVE